MALPAGYPADHRLLHPRRVGTRYDAAIVHVRKRHHVECNCSGSGHCGASRRALGVRRCCSPDLEDNCLLGFRVRSAAVWPDVVLGQRRCACIRSQSPLFIDARDSLSQTLMDVVQTSV
jgi:hypothetical protein